MSKTVGYVALMDGVPAYYDPRDQILYFGRTATLFPTLRAAKAACQRSEVSREGEGAGGHYSVTRIVSTDA